MKARILIPFFFIFSIQFIHAQTKQDTAVVSVETRNAGVFSGKIIFESNDSIKIKTSDLGIVTIAKNEIVNRNLITIETIDGNEFIGEIIREDSLSVVLKTQNFGEVSIFKSNIKKKQQVEVQQIKDGKYWFPNPQSTRYFWSPNGYGLKKGEGYYQNIWVLWNQFAYGITDHFSLGGGIIPTFLFAGAPTPVFATVKFSIPAIKNKLNFGVGSIAGYVLGEDGAGFGIFYGTSTFGTPDKNVSFGIGEMFAGGEWAPTPLFNFSGMFRISSKGYFLTENYFLMYDNDFVLTLLLGGRSIIKKVSLDYGLFIPFASEMDNFVAFPWLGLEIPLGKSKNKM
jgi:RNase P/RNase MRP subunit p29